MKIVPKQNIFFTRNGPGEKKQKKQKKKKKKNRFGGGERAAAAEIEDGERVAVGGVSEVGSQSEEVLESEEDVQVEEQDSTSLETFQDELGSSAQFKEDSVYVNHLESALMVKEAELRELLESEIDLIESNKEEMDALIAKMDQLVGERHVVDKTLAELEAQMREIQISKDQLVEEKKEKERMMKDISREKARLRNYLLEKLTENKEKKRQLERDMEELRALITEHTRGASPFETQSECLKLLMEVIESKEKDLECPICFKLVSAPLFCCEEQHLICSECLPKASVRNLVDLLLKYDSKNVREQLFQVSTCPECCKPYPADPLRHRFAERLAEEVERLRRKLDRILLSY